MKKIANPFNAATAVSLFLLIVYLVAASFPQYRIWGLNLWAYFPSVAPWGLFGAGVLIVVSVWFYGRSRTYSDDGSSRDVSPAIFWAATGALTLLMVLLFYYLRARTHFLGDGYTVLSLLSDPEPIVKTREYGSAMLHIWGKQIYGEGEPAALAAFRTISIGCGFLFLLSTAILSRRLFDTNRDRILLLIGLASCGFMYNFFGYVENYSLFMLTSLLYCLTGLLVSLGRAPRWALAPLLGLTVLSHILGVVFLPSAIYLMLRETRLGARVGRLSIKSRRLLVAVGSGIGLATFLHFYYNYYYLRLSLTPLMPDRFTVEGYHLFSAPHLLDLVNMALLLAPALPVVIAVALFMPLRSIFRRSEYRYLALLALCSWSAVFIFDPKLGMPRDWDLFSFAGLPLALLLFYFMLDSKVRPKQYVAITLMMTLLGLVVLFPRAISQTNPDQSVVWFNNYTSLDRTKNMYGRTVLKKYYDRRGDAVASELEYQRYIADYPQFVLNREGIALKNEGKYIEAIAKYRKALKLHPTFVAPYANIGMCYRELGQFDSAVVMLNIAIGMNPYNFSVYSTLARTYFELGDATKAEELLLQARELSPSELQPLVGLVQLYKSTNALDSWLRCLNELVARDDAPIQGLTELAKYHLNKRQYVQAAPLYRRAIAQGLDSAYAAQLRKSYPQLGL